MIQNMHLQVDCNSIVSRKYKDDLLFTNFRSTWFIEPYFAIILPKPYMSQDLDGLPHSDIKYVAAYWAGNSHVSQALSSYNHTGD